MGDIPAVPRVPAQRDPRDAPVMSPADSPADSSAALRFSVLGPIRAWRDETQLPTGSPQQRALLAALLLREGRTATAAELIRARGGPPGDGGRADRRAVGRGTAVAGAGGGTDVRLAPAEGAGRLGAGERVR